MAKYNTLLEVKQLLNDFRGIYSNQISKCRIELKPDYSRTGFSGYVYTDFEDREADFIYTSIGALEQSLNSEVFEFDILGNFIKPEKAIQALTEETEVLKEYQKKLFELKTKYTKGKLTPYQISITLTYYEKVMDILDIALNHPDLIEIFGKDKDVKGTNKVEETIRLDESFDIAIITALYDSEFEALLKLPIIFEKHPVANDPTDYRKGNIGTKRILIATDHSMGMASAASLSSKIIAKFSPEYLIMGGIAGGVKRKDVEYGDILLARNSYNYESGKYKFIETENKTIFEPDPIQISLEGKIVTMVNKLSQESDELEIIWNLFSVDEDNLKANRKPKVIIGPLATGSAVIADSKKVKEIKLGTRKLIGIDMETFGVYCAATNFSNTNKTIPISIKSISDFANVEKDDRYRKYAAFTSAQFIYQLILKFLQ